MEMVGGGRGGGVGSARLGGNGVLSFGVSPSEAFDIRFNNQLRSSSLCLCRVCAKIISASIS